MLKSIRSNAQSAITKKEKSVVDISKIDDSYADKDPYFLKYQVDKVRIKNDKNLKLKVIVWRKSRQIGASFVMSYICFMDAIQDIRDCVYTSYNKDSAKQFIKDVRKWATLANIAFEFVARSQAININNINVFEVKFNNGRTITAIAGNANNLRAKPGNGIVIDEAAYRIEPLEDIIAAAMATVIHGGWIFITSTHAGIDADFNKLILKIEAGELPYELVTTTFRDAIADGLYKVICNKNKIEWTLEGELEWIKSVYAYYGIRASEELDVLPGDFKGGDKIFSPSIFTKYHVTNYDGLVYFRYYDIASSTDADAYYSADVLVAYDESIEKLIILDYNAAQLTPMEGDTDMEDVVKRSPYGCIHLIEIEPGASGIKYVEYMKDRLDNYTVFGYRPLLSKLQRAIPVGNAANKGKVVISDMLYHDNNGVERCEFVEIIRKFDGKKQPLVNDLVDCLSGIYDYFRQNYGDSSKAEKYDSLFGE